MNRNYPRHEPKYSTIRRLIYQAVDIWQRNSNLKLQEVSDDSADILIDFARGNHGDNFDFNGAGGSLGTYGGCPFLIDNLLHFFSLLSSASQRMHSTQAVASVGTFTWTRMRPGTLTPVMTATSTSFIRCCTSWDTHWGSRTRASKSRSCILGIRTNAPSRISTKTTSSGLSSCMDGRRADQGMGPSQLNLVKQRHDARRPSGRASRRTKSSRSIRRRPTAASKASMESTPLDLFAARR